MKTLRIDLIFALAIIFSLVILNKLFSIQVINQDFYKALAEGFQVVSADSYKERGEIFFENGVPLAVNKNWQGVFVSPPKIKDFEKTADTLGEILHLDKDLILKKIKSRKLSVPIKRRLSEREINDLKKIKLPGVYLGKERGRYYPQANLFSQSLGFVDADSRGEYGLEQYYDKDLREGKNLILAVDYNIQFEAERLLEKAKKDLDIMGGQIVVIEPNSGKIIALSSFPNFDPNSYQSYANKGKTEIFQNPVTQQVFEPGSVFKAITMASALNEGKISPQTTYLDTGFLKIDGWTIYNYGRRIYRGKEKPEITMTEVLEKSVNTGAVFAEQKLGYRLFFDYIKRFEFFDKTGIDLPEVVPQNKELKEGWEKGREINFATASYGQGIEVTPIQLVKAYCAIANGGRLITPYLVKNKKRETKEKQIISPKVASQLTAMLVSVVENGYGRSARIPGYYIAGKTGTAQISFSALGIDKKGYSEKTWQSFIGYAPAFNPRFLILVKLDNPKTKTAEYSAGPIFRQLAEYIINYYQIPPDY